ncbi:C39 family peptidase [Cognatazoarcus halotolerans]|uniref:C39 family peptidase n=1 Tax=Cognatazoarcus halotolerans TaxID=2686016 RepID=UPI0013590D4F|nr:C39 family peptidase [Cognatazoarcus halotolerans]MCB1910754.1 C39 family peptidase [Rhodocyclaceae bacterium]MCP5239928.1 C39 family peptidase [Zoogloeaceae bacterium]HQU89139.1 C39 family peptidase [Denitromonas sp.]MCP5293768.1 C39 family peptidase [Zoogloeaceae bacterium]MCW5613774.1 C39 family peptidase [Rhodocyclaceae bacterium]
MRSTRVALAAVALTITGVSGGAELRFSPDVVGPYRVPVTSLKEARNLTTLQQQFDFSCGSAALATLLTHHYDFPVNEQAVFAAMFQHGDQAKIRREGFSLLDMKNFLAARGFQADGFEAPLDALVKAKIPAIALVNEKGYNHFVVVKGVKDGRVVLGDPAFGTRAMSRHDFEAIWSEKILFVVRSHQNIAHFNRPVDWKVVPRAPLEAGLRGSIDMVRFMRNGGDF